VIGSRQDEVARRMERGRKDVVRVLSAGHVPEISAPSASDPRVTSAHLDAGIWDLVASFGAVEKSV